MSPESLMNEIADAIPELSRRCAEDPSGLAELAPQLDLLAERPDGFWDFVALLGTLPQAPESLKAALVAGFPTGPKAVPQASEYVDFARLLELVGLVRNAFLKAVDAPVPPPQSEGPPTTAPGPQS